MENGNLVSLFWEIEVSIKPKSMSKQKWTKIDAHYIRGICLQLLRPRESAGDVPVEVGLQHVPVVRPRLRRARGGRRRVVWAGAGKDPHSCPRS